MVVCIVTPSYDVVGY